MDKQRNHVNDFDVEIDDEKIIVRYILKNGSMGLGFEENKDDFINKVLDVRKIFPAKLSILPKVELDNIQRDSLMADIKAPDVLMRNIEKLAVEIHEQYKKTSGNKEVLDFNDLSSDLKMSISGRQNQFQKSLRLSDVKSHTRPLRKWLTRQISTPRFKGLLMKTMTANQPLPKRF